MSFNLCFGCSQQKYRKYLNTEILKTDVGYVFLMSKAQFEKCSRKLMSVMGILKDRKLLKLKTNLKK